MINLDKIDDEWIMVLCAMFKDCAHMVDCSNVNKQRRELALPFRQARKIRNIKKISVYDKITDLKKDIFGKLPLKGLPEGLVLSEMTDNEVKILYAMGAEIMDYSCLGTGIRPYVEAIWVHSEEELDKRNVTGEFFCDWEII
jgi:hypothetical protein